jgi:hypothetical protein
MSAFITLIFIRDFSGVFAGGSLVGLGILMMLNGALVLGLTAFAAGVYINAHVFADGIFRIKVGRMFSTIASALAH